MINGGTKKRKLEQNMKVSSMSGYVGVFHPKRFISLTRRRFPCKGREARSHAKYQSHTPYFRKIL